MLKLYSYKSSHSDYSLSIVYDVYVVIYNH